MLLYTEDWPCHMSELSTYSTALEAVFFKELERGFQLGVDGWGEKVRTPELEHLSTKFATSEWNFC